MDRKRKSFLCSWCVPALSANLEEASKDLPVTGALAFSFFNNKIAAATPSAPAADTALTAPAITRRNQSLNDMIWDTFTVSSDILVITNAQEAKRLNVKSTGPAALQNILATETRSSDNNIKINSNPIFSHLIISLIHSSNAPPIHTRVASAVLEHQLQRIHGLGMIRAAGTSFQRRCTLWHVRA
ncbi:hypothetical protein SDJN02_10647, partial [Cucurbita argyrosperma subsp. argyrosperma]